MLLHNNQLFLTSVLLRAQMPDDYATKLCVDINILLWKKNKVMVAKSKQTKLVVTVAVMVGSQKQFALCHDRLLAD